MSSSLSPQKMIAKGAVFPVLHIIQQRHNQHKNKGRNAYKDIGRLSSLVIDLTTYFSEIDQGLTAFLTIFNYPAVALFEVPDIQNINGEIPRAIFPPIDRIHLLVELHGAH